MHCFSMANLKNGKAATNLVIFLVSLEYKSLGGILCLDNISVDSNRDWKDGRIEFREHRRRQ